MDAREPHRTRRMLAGLVWLVTGACAWIAPTETVPTDFATPPTAPPLPTDTPEDTVTVRYLIFEEDRDCWAVRDVERPIEYWGQWFDYGCAGGHEADPAHWISEGHCAHFQRSITEPGHCQVNDPTGWILPCDSSVDPCCDRVHPATDTGSPGGVPRCFPNPYWEP